MPDRLDATDAALLRAERVTTPAHVGSVMIFEPLADGLDHERLTELVAARIGEETRYRQRVREVPGGLGAPVWVDDVAFDIGYHVRRAALPRPGGRDQLSEFVARVMGRPLDRARPLWELYLLEGLAGGEFAVVTKVHEVLVDAVNAVDVAHLVLDEAPDVDEEAPAGPARGVRREPSDVELVAGAVVEAVVEALLHPLAVPGGLARRGLERVGVPGGADLPGLLRGAGALAARAAAPTPRGPLDGVRVGAARRVHMSALSLADFRAVREAAEASESGPAVSVHDVVLAAVSGGLRTWLGQRGEPVHSGTVVRALVPVSTSGAMAGEAEDGRGPRPGEAEGAGAYPRWEARRGGVDLADRVVGTVVDLPVGEPGALTRLERISFDTAHLGGVGAARMASAAGFAPSTLHHLGARLGHLASARCPLVVTNVPGPQRPRYLPGARLLQTYPILPLGRHHALAIGLTSYDGLVCLGLSADRAAVGDVDLLGEAIAAELEAMLLEFGLEAEARDPLDLDPLAPDPILDPDGA